ncbi:hypothetical protein GCM10027280_48360 [Micromonospora polyrhachis]
MDRQHPEYGPELVHVGDVDLPRHPDDDHLIADVDLDAKLVSALPHISTIGAGTDRHDLPAAEMALHLWPVQAHPGSTWRRRPP